jgi:hypothetical protein
MNSFLKVTLIAFLASSITLVHASLPGKTPQKCSLVKNSADSLHQPIQISFVPYFGTNGFQSDSIRTDVSVNILAGIVYEVKQFEIGGMFNIVKQDAGTCQLAGMGNIVMGKSTGFQGAGMANFTNILDGVQLAGTINSAGTAHGFQIAGTINHASRGKCTQLAGIANNTLDSADFQIAGIFNYASVAPMFQISGLINVTQQTQFQIAGLVNHAQKVDKFQISGLVNNTSGETKLQIAGLVNNAPKIKSLQIAGLVNNSNEISGTQIAGLVNRATYFKGMQIGLVNIADSCNGIPIGLISIVKKGYHKFEISGDELFYSNIAFRSGVQKLHGILIAGIQPDNFTTPLWTYGFGLGSLFHLSEKTLLGLDIVSQNVIKGHYIANNYLYKIGAGIDRKIAKNMSIYFGVTYNFLLTDKRQSHYDSYSSIAPYSFTENENSHFNLKTWAGFKVALRFF